MANKSSLTSLLIQRIQQASVAYVWTPGDFLDLGNRDAIDKALQRMVANNQLRRIARGLYDQVRINELTGQLAAPNYLKVIDAVGRRDQARILIDGITAANDLGLTNAVPAKVIVHTDAQLLPIRLGQLTLKFKLTSPSKLYWAGRPAMRIVQALYWLRDGLQTGSLIDEDIIQNKLIRLLQDQNYGAAIQDDLILGLNTLPEWMQVLVRNLLVRVKHENFKQ